MTYNKKHTRTHILALALRVSKRFTCHMPLSMMVDCTPTTRATNDAFMYLPNTVPRETTDGFSEDGTNAEAVVSRRCLVPVLENMFLMIQNHSSAPRLSN